MFQIGDAVLYDMWGVCIIEAVERQKTGEGLQDYVVLKPIYHNTAKLYLPNREETLHNCLRPVIGSEEIRELLESLDCKALSWEDNPKERGPMFRRILASGDRKQILELIALLYLRKLELRAQGKDLRMTDEQALREGEKLLNGEFAYVLGLSPEEVPTFIRGVIELSGTAPGSDR